VTLENMVSNGRHQLGRGRRAQIESPEQKQIFLAARLRLVNSESLTLMGNIATKQLAAAGAGTG
jgi:hypothetical protein